MEGFLAKVQYIREWVEYNSGFLSVAIITISIIVGWLSGTFKAIRRKPKLSVNLNKPSFYSIRCFEEYYQGISLFRPFFLLYLDIKNIGYSPTTITGNRLCFKVRVGKIRFKKICIKDVPVLGDVGHTIGENLRVFPFLIQKNTLMNNDSELSYLKEGGQANGMLYFESPKCWGDFVPYNKDGKTKIYLKVIHTMGKPVSKKFLVEEWLLSYAEKFNKNLGWTLETVEYSDIEEWRRFE